MRETLEETGLRVVADRLLGQQVLPFRDDLAYDNADWLVTVSGGRLQAADDALDARWFATEELDDDLLTPDLRHHLTAYGVLPAAATPKSVDSVTGKTVQARVYQVLRDAIFDGTFPSQARIRQSEIAATLGVSVSPVREALRDLAAQGLVAFDPHRGATVASFEVADFEEMIEVCWCWCRCTADA